MALLKRADRRIPVTRFKYRRSVLRLFRLLRCQAGSLRRGVVEELASKDHVGEVHDIGRSSKDHSRPKS